MSSSSSSKPAKPRAPVGDFGAALGTMRSLLQAPVPSDDEDQVDSKDEKRPGRKEEDFAMDMDDRNDDGFLEAHRELGWKSASASMEEEETGSPPRATPSPSLSQLLFPPPPEKKTKTKKQQPQRSEDAEDGEGAGADAGVSGATIGYAANLSECWTAYLRPAYDKKQAERKRTSLSPLPLPPFVMNADDAALIEEIAACHLRLGRAWEAYAHQARAHLVVDSAERAVWPFFKYAARQHPGLFLHEDLAPGDYEFRIGKQVDFVIERKGARDINARSDDGREQRSRMKKVRSLPDNQKMFLFEEEPHLMTTADLIHKRIEHMPLGFNGMWSFDTHTRHHHGLQTYRTKHLLETVWFLSKSLEAIMQVADQRLDPKTGRLRPYVVPMGGSDTLAPLSSSSSSRAPPMKTRKSDIRTPFSAFVNALIQRGNVGYPKAEAIARRYGSDIGLAAAYLKVAATAGPEACGAMLAGLPYTPDPQKRLATPKAPPKRAKSTKQPTISMPLSQHIYAMLSGQEEAAAGGGPSRSRKRARDITITPTTSSSARSSPHPPAKRARLTKRKALFAPSTITTTTTTNSLSPPHRHQHDYHHHEDVEMTDLQGVDLAGEWEDMDAQVQASTRQMRPASPMPMPMDDEEVTAGQPPSFPWQTISRHTSSSSSSSHAPRRTTTTQDDEFRADFEDFVAGCTSRDS